nr:Retrovirus-related Pol polyprotein from transposon TNT 1-94 [Ipomoea batatas]
MAFMDANDSNKEDTWFLILMCGKKEYFTDFDESFADTVKLGNNTSLVMTGKGNVRLLVDGLSLREMTDHGYEDGSESNVQTTCGNCPIYVFQYSHRSKSSALALQIWALELQWSKDTSAKEHGERFAGTWFFLSNLQGLYGRKATTNDKKCENAGVCDLEWGGQENDVPGPDERDNIGESEVVTNIEKCTSDVSTSADLPVRYSWSLETGVLNCWLPSVDELTRGRRGDRKGIATAFGREVVDEASRRQRKEEEDVGSWCKEEDIGVGQR